MEPYWLDVAKRLQSLAQNGLAYTKNKFDQERYEELRMLSIEIMAKYTELEADKIRNLFASETGYQTPKVDIRAVVFKDNKIMLVREQDDGCWSLPGGFADIGYTPSEVAVKEVREESGLAVKPVRILAVLDKRRHSHPPSAYHKYKIIILCDITGGSIKTGIETSDVDFFDKDSLPQLSTARITESQLKAMFEFLADSDKAVLFD